MGGRARGAGRPASTGRGSASPGADGSGVLLRVAAWNAGVVGGAGSAVAVAFVVAGRAAAAAGIGIGAWLVAGSAALSAAVAGRAGHAGAAAGFAYAVKLLLLVGVAFAASRIGSVDRLALLAAVAVGLVVSLAVDALVVLLSRQSNFRETHDGDSQPR